MDWPEQRREGFALAAAARGDRGAQKGASGLCADVVAEATSVAARLAASDAVARRRWVRAVLRVEVGIGTMTVSPPSRALSLLAPGVDKELGRRWLRAAPLPRPGYVPEPRLLALLRKLVAIGNGKSPAPTGGAWRA